VADQLVVTADKMQAHLRELEAELGEYPDQRGEILLEIAGVTEFVKVVEASGSYTAVSWVS
jgi:hypothetical protein